MLLASLQGMPAARGTPSSAPKRPAAIDEQDDVAFPDGQAANWARSRERHRELVRDVRAAASGLGWAAITSDAGRQGSHSARFTFPSQGTFAQFAVSDLASGSDFAAQLRSARAANELHVLSVLGFHSNIVEVLTPAPELLGFGAHCLLTRLCPGTLADVAPDDVLGQAAAQRALLRGILCGVGYMHEKQIAHRRISPDHVLLPNGGRQDLWHTGAQLSGFKDTASFAAGPMYGLGGERDTRWLAPEMCTLGAHSQDVDVWAAAASVCGAMCGRAVQTQRLRRALHDFGTNNRTVEFTPARFSDGPLEHLLRSCLCPRPSARPSAADALATLEQSSGGAKRRKCSALEARPRSARPQPLSGDHTRQLARDVRSALEGRGTATTVLRQHFSEGAVGRTETALSQLQELAALTETPLPTAVVALFALAVADTDPRGSN